MDGIEEFYKLKNLENLQQLILSDSKSNGSNPICVKNREYKIEISQILPKIEIIDG